MFAFIFTLALNTLTFAATGPSEVVIIALGDSLTDGYGIERPQAFPQLLQEKFRVDGFKQVKVINGGISGSTSAGSDQRLKWFLKSKPQVLLLALGANDGLRGVPASTTRENLLKTIRLAKTNNMKIVLAGMMLPPNYGAAYTTQFRNMFAEIAKSEKLDLIPFLLEGVAGDQKLNQEDCIHPNVLGHIKVADHVYKTLKPSVLKLIEQPK